MKNIIENFMTKIWSNSITNAEYKKNQKSAPEEKLQSLDLLYKKSQMKTSQEKKEKIKKN